MSIIDPGDFPIDPDIVDGTQLAEILNRLKMAIYSNHGNTTRPADITEGGIWTKYTAPSTYQVLIFDGVTDAPLTVAGLAKGTSLANPFDGAVSYATGALIWNPTTETLLSAKYAIPSGGAFNAGDWNANAKVEGSFLHLTGGTLTGPVAFNGAVSFVSTVGLPSLTPSRALGVNASGNLAASSATVTELSYLSGVTSAIQTQINGKQATITGGATSIVTANLTASRALVSDASGKVAVSVVTATEVGYLDGVTSAIQTQLNAKADVSDSWPGVYTGTNADNTAFPVGSMLYWKQYGTGNTNLNAAPTGGVYVGTASTHYHYGTNNVAFDSTRVICSGTWRFRGGPDGLSGLVQRTA